MKPTLLKAALDLELGDATPVGQPLGEPVAVTRSHGEERADQVETGVWECTPGIWRRSITAQEFCHFIAGRGTYTPEGEAPIAFQAGDALLLPENSLGVWDIQETVRKTYVLIYRNA